MDKSKRNILFITLFSALLCCLFTALFGNNFTQKKVSASSDNPYYSISVSTSSIDYSATTSPYVVVEIDYDISSDLAAGIKDENSNWYFLIAYGEPSQIEYVYNVFTYHLYDNSDSGPLFNYYTYGDFVNAGSQKYFRYYDDAGNSIFDNLTLTSNQTMLEVFKFLKSNDVAGGFNFARLSRQHLNGNSLVYKVGYGFDSYDGESDLSYFSLVYYDKIGPYGYDCDRSKKDVYLKSSCSNTFTYSYDQVISSSVLQTRVKAWEQVLGTYRSGNTKVTYDYLVPLAGHFNKAETKTGTVSIESYLVPFEEYVKTQILNCTYVGGNGLSGFDVRFTSYSDYKISNGKISELETFTSKIIRQATGFDYKYDSYLDEIPSTVTMNVVYADYNYSDFYVRIENTNSLYANNIVFDFFPIVTESNDYITLMINYNYITYLFNNTTNWSVRDDSLEFYYNKNDISNKVTVEETDEYLSFCVHRNYQRELFGIEVTGMACVTIPVEMDVTVRYGILSNDLDVSYAEFSAGKIYDNEFGKLANELLSKKGAYADKIYGSIKNSTTGDVDYLKPIRVGYVSNYDSLTAIFQVYYEELPIFVITNNINSDVILRSIPDSMSEHSLKDYNLTIPDGYRVESFDYSMNRIVFKNGSYDRDNPLNSIFYLKNGKGAVGIKLILTDKWQVKINYLEQYKSSCFAVMKEFKGEIKVSDYEDVHALSGSDVSKILGQDVVVLNFNKKSVKIDKVNVTFDENTLIYTIDLTYTYLSVKVIDSNGDTSEIKVALTPYSQWNNYFGEDWSIVYLAPDVFKYTNDVEVDKLYGFFSVVTFKEQITNFNSWFKEYTSDGCVTTFSAKEVKGSEWYKFLNASGPLFALAGGTTGLFVGHPIAGAVVGEAVKYTLMSAAELANDENGTYYSYFFYLDGTSDKSYTSHNGADDYYDESSAVQNKAEDVADEVKDFALGIWDKIKSFFSETTVGKIIKWTAIILGGLIGLTIVIVIIKWIYRKITS